MICFRSRAKEVDLDRRCRCVMLLEAEEAAPQAGWPTPPPGPRAQVSRTLRLTRRQIQGAVIPLPTPTNGCRGQSQRPRPNRDAVRLVRSKKQTLLLIRRPQPPEGEVISGFRFHGMLMTKITPSPLLPAGQNFISFF